VDDTLSAVVNGKYYENITREELATLTGGDSLSTGYQGYDRRRQYEDHAQDTVQPYDAAGKPRAEFYRLYPDAAQKVFSKDEIKQVKRVI
jgi:hypothetical protein